MGKEKKDKHFIKKPVYPGGPKAFKQFIAKNLKYPEEAEKNRIEGTVYLKYDIDYKGNVIDAYVKSGIGYGCDEEAIRLVKLLKFEVPKSPRKLKVLFHKTTQIHFRLPPKTEQFVFTYSSKKKDTLPPEKKQDKKLPTYHYTIKW